MEKSKIPIDWKGFHALLEKHPPLRSAEEKEALKSRLKADNPFFANLINACLSEYVSVVSLEEFEQDATICLQEECSDKFYYILRGSVVLLTDMTIKSKSYLLPSSIVSTASKTPKQTTKKRKGYGNEIYLLTSGEWFGQFTCMRSDSKSPFTILTTDYTELLTISKTSFQRILYPLFESGLKDIVRFLCSHYPILQTWFPCQLCYLCSIFQEKEYSFNETIFTQGSKTKCIYFIKSGQVNLSIDPAKTPNIKSYVRPPPGLLQQILATTSSSTPSYKKKRSHGKRKTRKPPIQQRVDPKLEREQVLRRYRFQSINHIHNAGICTLMTGGILNSIEAACGIREEFFSAIAGSHVVVYKLDLDHFDVLFKKIHLRSLHYLIHQLIDHVHHWQCRMPHFEIFKDIMSLLEQNLHNLERSGQLELDKGTMKHKTELLPELTLQALNEGINF